MAAHPISHPSPDVLRALAGDRLPDAEAKAVLAHLSDCRECWQVMTTLGIEGRLRAAETTPSGGTIGPARAAAAAENIPPELRDHPEFEVIRKLGGGGMGVVYLARDRLTHRQEVLKVVNPYLATQPGAAERFLREIRAVVQLAHPNIVTAYGALHIGGVLVLKMEYVPGDDLNTVVKNSGPLPVVNACYYSQQVALGLQYAFEKGMIHRDIKPGNLILSRDGKKHVVKVLDFGLVKAMAAQGDEVDHLTMTAQGMGTPAYMAPEQAKDAARADIRADIYSLGCTLYFLLAGRPPFAGSSPYDLWDAHRTREAAPLSEVRKDVPPELAAVAAKMLAKDPTRRYQEPGEVAQALKPFVKAVLKSLPAAAPPPPPEKGGPTEPAKPVANPATRTGPPPTGDHTAKQPPQKRPARQPARKSKGGALAVVLGVAALLLLGICGGAVYWAVSASTGRDDTSHEFVANFTQRDQSPGSTSGGEKVTFPGERLGTGSAAPKSTGSGGPKPAGDVPARVKAVSGIELVSIPNGSFYMGSPGDDKDADEDEKPQHKVTISQPFYLGKYKVTRGQFQRFVAENPTFNTEAPKTSDDHPVTSVSWEDADAFCKWLAKETGANVRLPYEAEWEYSCRAVREAKRPTTKYYFGDDEAKLGDYAWYGGNSGGTTHPCGQKTPNAFGLYDMHGLVYEWCFDGMRMYENQDETDPVGPKGAGASRVARGGSFVNGPRFCRAADRYDRVPSYRRDVIGFRVLVSR